MEKELNLQQTFSPLSKEEWKQKVIEDLKGADFDRKLVWKTYEGIPVQPFYTQEDTEGKALPSDKLNLPEETTRTWVNYLEITVEDASEANRLAVKMLDFDTTGILFYLKNPESTDLNTLLQNLPLASLQVSFKTATPNADVLQQYVAYCQKNCVALDDIKGFYQADVLENYALTGAIPDFTPYAEVIKVTQTLPNFFGITLPSHAFADSGANNVQEIAFLANKLVDYLTELTVLTGLDAKTLLKEVLFNTAIGGDYFFEISKLRALRLVYQTVAQTYGLAEAKATILASSGLWTKSLFDPNVNLLRNTTEAMAALLGGCDALLIQPHNSSFEKPSDFSHRIALNLSNLLKGESHFDKVIDPAAGSYYIENLTENIAQKAWELFQQVENKGGFAAAFEAGFITESIQATASQKLKDISARKKVFVGTNKYPNATENISVTEIEHLNNDATVLSPQRATQAFDALRLRTLQHQTATGYIPKVYMACFGNLAMRKARATFAAEFFGVAGFQMLGEFTAPDLQQLASNAAKSEADIVVMCAADPDYETDAATFAAAFKAKAPNKQLVLAGYPAAIVDELTTVGVDSFIHIKVNAIDALTEYQDLLFETSKTL